MMSGKLAHRTVKVVASICAVASLGTGMLIVRPKAAFAQTITEAPIQVLPTSRSTSSIDQSLRNYVQKHFHYTDNEMAVLSDEDIDALYFDFKTKGLDSAEINNRMGKQKGRVTNLVKAVLRVWRKLPRPVKAAIGAVGPFLSAIAHASGQVDHCIYTACRRIGMNRWWANFVTKTISALI